MTHSFRLFRAIVTATLLSIAASSPAEAQVVQPFASGLLSPAKVVSNPDGTFLVAEAGSGPNTGRVSLVDRDGRRFTVVDGLPSGLHGPRLDPSGPAGVLLSGRRLYIVIGNGDISIPGAAAASEIPNPAPSSPLFSSLLLLEFTGDLSTGFHLAPSAHATLAAGRALYLHNVDGEAARISRLVDFPDYVAEPRPDEPRNVRIANPFGIVGNDARVWVNDASMNLVWNVRLQPSITLDTLTTVAPVPNPLAPMGGPVSEAVPAGIRVSGDSLLVSLLTGFPFGPGAARVLEIDRNSGATRTLASNLQTAIDVIPMRPSSTLLYVLEYSTAFLAGAPGRLLQVDAERGTALPLAAGLRTPTSMALDRRTGDLVVTEFAGGRLLRVLVPR